MFSCQKRKITKIGNRARDRSNYYDTYLSTENKIPFLLIVGHPEPEKKILLAFLSTFWHPCSKCILMCLRRIGVDAKSGNVP